MAAWNKDRQVGEEWDDERHARKKKKKRSNIRGHKRQLLLNLPLNDLGIHHQPVHDIVQQNQARISTQETFRNAQPPVCAIVQRALEDLGAVHIAGVLWLVLEVTAEGAETF